MRCYFNARWYDPEIGRFTSRDPKEQFWTPYSYVGNAPLTGFDPDGMEDLGADPNRPNVHVDFTQESGGDMKFEDFYVSKEVRQYAALMQGGSDPFGLMWNIKDVHWFERVTANGFPSQDESEIKKDPDWTKLTYKQSLYHMQGGAFGNRKYVNLSTGQEMVFTPNGSVVTDPQNAGTFNYSSPSGFSGNLGHVFLDMVPYWFWGNSPYDKTPLWNRVTGPDKKGAK